MSRGSWRSALGVPVVLVLVVGCGPARDPRGELLARPTLEQAGSGYLAMMGEMRAGIEKVAPSLVWRSKPARDGEAGCGEEYAEVREGTEVYDAARDIDGTLPLDGWPAVLGILREAARKHGFTHEETLKDHRGGNGEPSDHVVRFADDLGAYVEFGTYRGTYLSLMGACFLPAADHHPVASASAS